MKLQQFRDVVAQSGARFESLHKATAEDLSRTEAGLGVKLPASLRWLLLEHGCSQACGIESLSQLEALTARCRLAIALPNHIVVLADWNDSGVVYLDYSRTNTEGEPIVVWTGAHNLYRLAAGTDQDEDRDEYAGFAEWAISRCKELSSEDGP